MRAPRRSTRPAWAGFLLAWLVAMLLVACSTTGPLSVTPDGWTYGARTLQLQLVAANTLNIDSGQPHSITLGVFQLSDPAAFGTLTATSAGAEKLLNLGSDGDPSIVGFDRIELQPGEKRTVYLNRAENAQYVGLVAGYYKIEPLQDVALFNIPIVPKPHGWVDKGMVLVGMRGAETDGMPGALALNVGLGTEEAALFAADTDGSARIYATKGGGKSGGGGGSAPASGGKSGGGGSSNPLSGIKAPSLPSVPISKPSSGSGSSGGSSSSSGG